LRAAHLELCEQSMRRHSDIKSNCEELGAAHQTMRQKHELFASELHEQINNLVRQTDWNQEQMRQVDKDLASAKEQTTLCQNKAAEQIKDGFALARSVKEAQQAQETLERRLTAEAGNLGDRIFATGEECQRFAATLESHAVRVSCEVARMQERISEGLTQCRIWNDQRLGAELDRIMNEVSTKIQSELPPLHAKLDSVKHQTVAAEKALATTESRINEEGASTREQLEVLSSGLAGIESQQKQQDVATKHELAMITDTLAQIKHQMIGEGRVVHERLDAISLAHTKASDTYRERLSLLSDNIVEVGNRLDQEREIRCRQINESTAALSSTEERLLGELSAIRQQLDAQGTALSVKAALLTSTDAALQSRLDAFSEKWSSTEGCLRSEHAATREKVETQATHIGDIRSQSADISATARSQFENIKAAQANVEAQMLAKDVVVQTRLDTLAMALADSECRFGAEDAAARQRLDSLDVRIEAETVERSRDDSSLRMRLDSAMLVLASCEARLDRDASVQKVRFESLSSSLEGTDSRLKDKDSKDIVRLDELTADISRLGSQVAREEASLREKIETVTVALAGMETRLGAADSETRNRFEDRLKEEVSWLLAVVKPLQQSIEKLGWGFHDLGHSQIRCSLEFDMLEQVVKEVECRTLPWRSGLSRDSLAAARLVQPRSPQIPTPTTTSEDTVIGKRTPQPLRPLSARPGSRNRQARGMMLQGR